MISNNYPLSMPSLSVVVVVEASRKSVFDLFVVGWSFVSRERFHRAGSTRRLSV
jgi:hypothetical protein